MDLLGYQEGLVHLSLKKNMVSEKLAALKKARGFASFQKIAPSPKPHLRDLSIWKSTPAGFLSKRDKIRFVNVSGSGSRYSSRPVQSQTADNHWNSVKRGIYYYL